MAEIKKKLKIKNFGIFKDFKWDNSINEFKKFNLIYGWNYSGKTTISRIFRSFEIGEKHKDYPNADFQLEDDQGNKFGKSDLNKLPNIRVYNVDFVKENLKWNEDDKDRNIEPILILGKENDEIREKLKKERDEKVKLEQNKNEKEKEINELDKSIEKKLTQRAKQTKEILQWPDYDKRILKKTIDEIRNQYEEYILDDSVYIDILKSYQSSEILDRIDIPLMLSLDYYESAFNKVKEIISRKIVSEIIEKLKNNPSLSEWVRQGKELHKNEIFCQFCGNPLPEDLLSRLEKHFSEDFDKLQNDITNLLEEIEKHKKSIKLFMDQIPDKYRLYKEFQTDFENKKGLFLKLLEAYLDAFNIFNEALTDKKKKPFSKPTIEKIDINIENIERSWNELIEIISKHNEKTDNFETEKERNKKALEKHFAAEFIKDEKYIENLEKKKNLINEIKEINNKIKESSEKIKDFESQISDLAKGAKKLNEILSLFFPSNALQIEPTEEGKFKLLRNGEVAKNLSEGEKTIISFSYFITRLEDKDTNLRDSIVFIDDPVCSLDLGHIHSIYALIENKFPKNGCSQFFVTTHNMEFLNLMKDFVKDRSNLRGNNDNILEKLPFYFIDISFNENQKYSKIVNMPKQLKKFRSEYVFLFSILNKFDTNNNVDFEKLYILPNIVRKFLESYLGFRFPDGKSIRNKISKLVTEKESTEIWKFISQYSHSGTSERITKFPDLSECQKVVSIVLDAIKKQDEEHFDILCEQCN